MFVRTWIDRLLSRLSRPPSRRSNRVADRRLVARRLLLEGLDDRRLLAFDLAVDYSTGTSPVAVVTADFNGDGRLDVITANSGSSNVSVLLGNAGGTFQTAQNSAVSSSPRSVTVGDFDGDGKLDLASTHASAVSVLLGNGNGTFQAPTSINFDSTPGAVAVGDFNADGNLDLGVALNRVYDGGEYGGSYSVAGINVLLGNGDGSFSTPGTTTFTFGYYPSAVAEDFNGDGRDDLAVTNYRSGRLEVQLANPDGSLGPPTNFAIGYSNPLPLASGDMDGDGRLDLVTSGGGSVSVLRGNVDGTFQPVQNSPTFGEIIGALALADVNSDDKPDLVTGNDSATVNVLLADGVSGFTRPIAVGAGVGVAVGDFNGDGRIDATSTSPATDQVSVLFNDGIWPLPDAPLISIGDASVAEGNTGTTAATITVSLSAAYNLAISVDYATMDGDATMAGGDYQAASGSLTFGVGETSKTVTVPVIGDRITEDMETFYVRLRNPINVFIADGTGAGYITDDEPSISIDSYISAAEGNTGTTPFTFTVTLSAVYDAPVNVDYATADLSLDEQSEWGVPGAAAGVDYTATSGTVTFAAGQTSRTITVLVNGDRVYEDDEYFAVNLTGATSALISNGQAVGDILNDEPYVSISGGGTIVEGNMGTKNLTFIIALSAAADAPVTVTYATANGSATAGSDYKAAAGSVTFAPGETSKTIAVQVYGDRVGEPNESFFVNLSSPTNAPIDEGTGQGTIVDDEPRISISDVTKAEGKKGQTTLFTFTITLSTAYDQAVTMSFRTVNGTATTANSDYVAKTGTLTFAPGETTKTITIEVTGDSKKEANEVFYLDLFGLSSNALFTKNRGLGTILNDD